MLKLDTVRISNNPVLDIKLPNLAGLTIMKLISWDEKYPERSWDAEDILFIMNNYHSAGNEDRLYDNEQELLEEEAFDIQFAGTRLLGKDIAAIADPETLSTVKSILDRETNEQTQYRLVEHMIRGSIEHDIQFEHVLSLIEKLNNELNNIR